MLCRDTEASLPRQPLPCACVEADGHVCCRAHSPHPKQGLGGWGSPNAHPMGCVVDYNGNTVCASIGDPHGKKSASKTITAKDGELEKASKSTFKSLLELAGLWKRGMEETLGWQLPLPTPQAVVLLKLF